ncbi:kinase-like protein [Basidiobolus meristosporus CBS 931.73]|uniref:non-specific serine/threonine protein kinase n=1 Tax=Basidiobolus meristosporus CBS 931.73 TaxID=1314790 RepID=A0A1Y1XWJ7_9FUNG|nr:kinase-like protein [Basidiobolus meristosporus CBS 931.73]|eukprot:ORX89714.1 kinase-like protein [Basidiobolus meristosporus CBS 931.73]
MLWRNWICLGFLGGSALAKTFEPFEHLLSAVESWNLWDEMDFQNLHDTSHYLTPLLDAFDTLKHEAGLEDGWEEAIEEILRDDLFSDDEQEVQESHEQETQIAKESYGQETSIEDELEDEDTENSPKNRFRDFDMHATLDQIEQVYIQGSIAIVNMLILFCLVFGKIFATLSTRRLRVLLQSKINGLGFVKKRFNVTQKDEIHSFEMELEVMHSMQTNALHSPYLAKISCHGQDPDGIPYVLYEYLSGVDLSWESQFIGVSSGGLKKIFAQFILGLQHFHHITGGIHGDVKPNNLMFTYYKTNDYIKLIDYGGMLPIRGPLWSDVMMFNDMTTAPEVYMDSHPQDRSVSDWFSMAASLYWLYVEHHIANNPDGKLSSYLDAFVPLKISQEGDSPSFTIPDRYPPYFEADFVDLLKRTVISDPYARLNLTSIKQHSFFKGVEWDELARSPFPETENPKQPACYPWEEKLETPATAYQCLNTYHIPDEELALLLGEKDNSTETFAQDIGTDTLSNDQ